MLKSVMFLSKIKLALILCLLTNGIKAHASSIPPVDSNQSKTIVWEIGASLGLPAAANATLGLWGPREFPVLAKVSGMHWGSERGIQFDLGWAFDRDSTFYQFVAVTYSRFTWPGILIDLDFSGIGLSYGLNWNGISAQIGIQPIKFLDRNGGVAPVIQAGYSFLL